MAEQQSQIPQVPVMDDDDEISLLDLLVVISENLKLLVIGPIAAGLLALGITFVIPQVYTAKTTILPPSSGSGGGAAAAILGQLGSLGGMVGGALPAGAGQPMVVKTMAYLNSDALFDEIIKKFDLQKRYENKYVSQTRKKLKELVVIKDDKKTGLVTIEFTDEDPAFAAKLVNEIVAITGRLLGEAALTDARAQRDFLEKQISEATKKTYQSPAVREAMIQNLIQQFERARIEEQQPNPNILQVDVAKAPELKSGPKHALIATITALATGFALLLFVFIRQAMRNASQDPESAGKLQKIRRAFGR